MYVGSNENRQVAIYDSNGERQQSVDLTSNARGLALNTSRNLLFASGGSLLSSIGFQEESSKISIDDQLQERAREFASNPVLVSGVQFIFNGGLPFQTLSKISRSITGTQNTQTISLADSQSPGNRSDTVDLIGLEDSVLDGRNGWGFTLAPKQRLTILLTYKQLDLYHLLPNVKRYA